MQDDAFVPVRMAKTCDLLYCSAFLRRSSVNEFSYSVCNMDSFLTRKQYLKEAEVEEVHIEKNCKHRLRNGRVTVLLLYEYSRVLK